MSSSTAGPSGPAAWMQPVGRGPARGRGDGAAQATRPDGTDPLPEGFGLVLDRDTRRHAGGTVLVGGWPRRVIRLRAAGAAAVDTLLRGEPTSHAGRTLARRLVDAGLAHPVPPDAGVPHRVDPRMPQGTPPAGGPAHAGPSADGLASADVTVVIPVRDRPSELARCLAALGGDVAVVVVDDGSSAPDAVRAVTDAAHATLVRRETGGGPAAARNEGLHHVTAPLVAFLDSDCVPPAGWLAPLVGHLSDPTVVAVAPRVRGAATGDTTARRWGRARSPLDLGGRPGRVAPGTPIAYVPTAALVVRRAALAGQDGPFDPALRHGEDVDLIWRLHDAGGTIRYEPAVVVEHHEPASWAELLVRRWRYGTSAGPLARRHGRRLAPVVLAPVPTAAAVAALSGRPRAALAIALAQGIRRGRRIQRAGAPAWYGPLWSLRSAVQATDGLARTATMLAPAALPVLAIARPRLARRVLGAVVTAPLARWAGARRDGTAGGLGPLRWAAASIADDLAYGLGVWAGARRSRDARALLPVRETPA
ncbi:MAG: mycofactocin biosynthesis glycosyltransferase MftF [Solirubrobacteraceae bacterium]